MERYTEALLECAEMETQLVKKAVGDAGKIDASETEQRLIVAQSLHRLRGPFLEKLAEFSPIPESRGSSCRCERTRHLSLPDQLEEQTIDLAILIADAKKRRAKNRLG